MCFVCSCYVHVYPSCSQCLTLPFSIASSFVGTLDWAFCTCLIPSPVVAASYPGLLHGRFCCWILCCVYLLAAREGGAGVMACDACYAVF
ncbi:hypothetical protein P171DRAFT_204269 [Karstenula rhodostoma CBS 690.94]|uniref:Uncharacterized protein n=1 Tax=Karstenula rhodostoma CBS 690.94 TaxID=1392251 RepID=A0A9P4PTM6_9PLEO|nr:hypothetical protein P171DRAFT_204269 [Karstenula rhodostoma CBS 690.94]